MQREKPKWRTHKAESTDAGHRDGPSSSSGEVLVMRMERRGGSAHREEYANQETGRSEFLSVSA